jgi:hypothetical protein
MKIIIKAPYPEFTEIIELNSPDFNNTVTTQPDNFTVKIAQDGTFYTFSKQVFKTYNFSFASVKFSNLDRLFKFLLLFKEGKFQVEGLETQPLIGAFILAPAQITYPRRDEEGRISAQFIGQ